MVTEESERSQSTRDPEHDLPPMGQQGFTIVEVIIAIVILTVGLLGFAGTTILVVQQTALAEVATDRAAALQNTIERLRALPFDSVVAGRDSVGIFDLVWEVTNGNRWRSVEIVTTGPGLSSLGGFPALAQSLPDTFTYRIIQR